jgi:hypothetical protein
MTQRFSEYLRGLPFSVEFHDAIVPHVRSGKIKTIIAQRPRDRDPTILR